MILKLKYAWKFFRNGRRYTFLILFNFTIALSGLISVLLLTESMRESLNNQSRNLVGADIVIQTRQDLEDKKISEVVNLIGGEKNISKVYSLYSMLSDGNSLRLIEIKGVDNKYPFYGEVQTQFGSLDLKNKKIVVYPELIDQIQEGVHSVQIGEKKFEIEQVAKNDTLQGGITTSMAPRVYMSHETLKLTELMKPGSTLFYQYLIKDERNDTQLIKKLKKLINDPEIRILSATESSEQIHRMTSYLFDFLGIVALIGLLLGVICIFYLIKSYISHIRKDLSILSFITGKNKIIGQIIQLQMNLNLAFSLILSLCISFAFSYWIKNLLQEYLKFQIEIIFDYRLVITIFTFILLLSVLVLRPIVYHQLNLSFGSILRSNNFFQINKSKRLLIDLIIFIIFFYFITIIISNSFFIGTIFVISLIIILGICSISVSGLLKFMASRSSLSNNFNYFIKNLSRERSGPIILVCTFVPILSFLIMISQLEDSVSNELKNDQSKQQVIFLFDVQEYQLNLLQETVKDEGGEVLLISPLVRSRLTSINNNKLKRADEDQFSRESQRSARFRNRGINLSFRDHLIADEKIVEGMSLEKFKKNHPNINGISIEKRYAQRMQIKIGDVLEFDVLGIKIKGTVANIRSVKWTTFNPNFFILFSSGLLEDAPKTYLTSINSKNVKKKIMNSVFSKFPNISMIDVERLIKKIYIIIDLINKSMYSMSVYIVILGLFIFFSLSKVQFEERSKNFILLKLLGAPYSYILKNSTYEISILMVLVLLFSLIFGTILSFIVQTVVFDLEFIFELKKIIFFILPSFLTILFFQVYTYLRIKKSYSQLREMQISEF